MSLLLEFDEHQLTANLRHLQTLAGPERGFIAALKANAYGHGAVRVARVLQAAGGVHSIATGTPAEARLMLSAGIAIPVWLLACAPPAATADYAAQGFTTTVADLSTAQAISTRVSASTDVYIKVDAGLGRLGIPVDHAVDIIKQIAALPRLNIAGIYTHASFKDDDGRAWSSRCLRRFDACLEQLALAGVKAPITQARASSALLAGLEDQCNAVCVGHALFGLSPFAPEGKRWMGALEPVLASVKTVLIAVNEHGQGADIGIAGLRNIPSGKRIGVAPVGRSHGVATPLPDVDAGVLVRGTRARILAVSLEHLTIELDGVPDARPGDEVVLVGRSGGHRIDLETVAQQTGTSPLDCMLGWSRGSAD